MGLNDRNNSQMLKSLEIKKFTVFAKASIEFSKGLNVIIGDNATRRFVKDVPQKGGSK